MSKNKSNRKVGFENPWVNVTLISLIFGLLFLSIRMQKNSQISSVKINIEAIDQNKYLITEKEILKIFKEKIGFDLNKSVVGELDLTTLESMIRKDERIEHCEMYVDKHFNINISIKQKDPLVRIEMQNGESYYLDSKGNYVSTYLNAAIRVPVATGYIHGFRKDFEEVQGNNLNGILEVAKHVDEDPFLNALVEQIHVKENGEIVVIPKLGRQRILLGSADDLENKFGKLKVYYKRVVPKEGLDRFPELNLKYKDRIFGVSEEI